MERMETEDLLHLNCIKWFDIQYNKKPIFIHHSPNENPRSSISKDDNGNKVYGVDFKMIQYNKKMKMMGRKKGFPDLLILYKSKTIFIEFKTIIGVLSPSQKEVIQEIENANGVVFVIRCIEDFICVVNDFIKRVDNKEECNCIWARDIEKSFIKHKK